jgi:hypothetical protein
LLTECEQSDRMAVTDKYGLVKDNELLVTYIPSSNKALVFRVITRQNKGFEHFDYGALPTVAAEVYNTYAGGVATVGLAGEMPPWSYVTSKKFPLSGCFDATDMWFVPYSWQDRVFHVKTQVKPGFLRVGLQIPSGVNQSRFQKERVVGGAETNSGFGYKTGEIETVHLPEIHYGYTFGNDTNLRLRTGVHFTYGEYVVKIPNSPSLIFDVLSKAYPAHWVGLPVSTVDSSITQGLKKTWGFDGFTVYPNIQRDQALNEYKAILGSADVCNRGVLM